MVDSALQPLAQGLKEHGHDPGGQQQTASLRAWKTVPK